MSGILGIWTLDGRPIARQELARLSASLAHRGPDAEGLEVRGSLGLACRLSRVLPESLRETQPVVDSTGLMLVFDGRLDNRDELLASLPAAADASPESPDSALALAAYRACGTDFAARLAGDFALGLFDARRQHLVLARDPIGLKPLYYHATPRLFVFASEIKALLAHPEAATQPDDDVLADFVFNRLSSHDSKGRTFFEDIFSVPPAHVAIVTPERIVVRRYWEFDPSRQVRCASFPEYAEAFREHFERAVRRRVRCSGPVAVAVSGGLDSSAIFCAAERLRRAGAGAPIIGASSANRAGSPADETTFVDAIERALDLTIHRFDNLPGLFDGCREMVWHVEAPMLDSQGNGTRQLMRGVRELGARVLLTGHWGDQFLFDDAYLVDLCLGGAWLTARRHLAEYRRWVDTDSRYFRGRLAAGLGRAALPEVLIPAARRVRDALWRVEDSLPWFTPRFRRLAAADRRANGQRWPGASAHARALFGEARSRYHVLCMEWNNKVGAMHGVDVAYPFLDRDLIAFLIATPGEIHTRGGVPKAILREALKNVLPEAIATRRSKADFTDVANAGVEMDLPRIVASIRDRRRVVDRQYVKPETVSALAGMQPMVAGPTCRTSWAIRDLFALELWLGVFFS